MNGPQSTLDLWPIGNCQVSGLIDHAAGLVWGCVPKVDGDPVFCSLLGGDVQDKGVWRFELEGQVSASQAYIRNTPILVTRLEADDGSAVEITDFCPRFERSGRMYRPVAYARVVRPVAGAPRLKITLRVARGYGAAEADTVRGTNHVRFLGCDEGLRLSTDAPVGYVLEGRAYRVESDQHFFLGPDEPFSGNLRAEIRQMEEQTRKYWQLWVRSLAIPLEWQDEVIRCAITLKLCQHEETGAIVAALTTSIPEAPNSERNWDYRYCWIRDSYYTVQALNRLGALDVLEKYLGFLRNVVDNAPDGDIQPLYSVMGEGRLDEAIAEDLSGYRGMGPVRVGNAAYVQRQYDCYGQIVLPSAHAFFDRRLLRMSDERDFASLEQVGDVAWKMHDRPDAGLWEFRTRTEVHTYSAMMCWAACDRLANVAKVLGKDDRHAVWSERARVIRDTIETNAWVNDPQGGHYKASYESDYLDASLLQLAEVRYIDADDPRYQSTLRMVESELRRGEHMLRYAAEDDFGSPETAFNVCTFWLIEALHLAHRDEEARDLFRRMLGHATPSGLLSEDMDFETGELWGNFPQTYSLVGVINCAVLLSKSWNTIR